MAKANKAVNAGVHGASGTEFQKHCALYILFDRYAELKDKSYFVCLEHLDDFLFCFLSTDHLVTNVDAYQAKKSSAQWGMQAELYELIHKVTCVGMSLHSDPIPKSDKYHHSLHFITNAAIQLSNGLKKANKRSEIINEASANRKFTDVDSSIKDKIITALKAKPQSSPKHLSELDNMSLLYIDLPKTTIGQKDNLVGKFSAIFGQTVKDHRAAVDTLLLLFRDVETFLNNGGVAQLLDKNKRVGSETISAALSVITTKQKAYELWRTKGETFAQALKINVWEQENFKLQFDNSFDLFKDLKQTEHRKILSFVRDNRTQWTQYYTDVACVEAIYSSFIKNNKTNLNEIDVKAAIFAAYVELKG